MVPSENRRELESRMSREIYVFLQDDWEPEINNSFNEFFFKYQIEIKILLLMKLLATVFVQQEFWCSMILDWIFPHILYIISPLLKSKANAMNLRTCFFVRVQAKNDTGCAKEKKGYVSIHTQWYISLHRVI